MENGRRGVDYVKLIEIKELIPSSLMKERKNNNY